MVVVVVAIVRESAGQGGRGRFDTSAKSPMMPMRADRTL
jgi:hypothetical protein